MSDASIANAAEQKGRSSSFFAALFAFVLLNISLSVLLSSLPDINQFAYLFMMQNQSVMPEIVNYSGSGVAFLGSSVIEVPLCLLDGKTGYSPKIGAAEKSIATTVGDTNLKSSLLSIEGGLLSDQYMVLRRLAEAKVPPRLIVLAIVPRDFYDTRFSQLDKTLGFRALADFSQLSTWPRYLSNVTEYCDATLDNSFWLYRFRPVLLKGSNQLLFAAIRAILPPSSQADSLPPAETKGTDFSRKADLALMEHSLHEYAEVYRGIDTSPGFAKQMEFLCASLHFAKQKNIPLLLVNLPLTEGNHKLLPAGFYSRYEKDVAECVAKNGCDFINLDSSKQFSDADFWDSGHLGLSGAKKLITLISHSVSSMSATSAQSSQN